MTNRLLQILPSSIRSQPVLPAAESVGDREAVIYNTIPEVAIWSRLDELTEDQLDHLAYHLHLDGYSYLASRAEKLWLVKNFHDWHRYKGTIHGHRLFWRVLLGREVFGHASRQGSFLGRELTDEERKRFEAPHPEIRIYPFRNRALARGIFFNCITTQIGRCFLPNDAWERIGKQAYLHDPVTGGETKLNRIGGTDDITRIAIRIKAAGQFLGVPSPRFTVDHQPAKRLYTLDLDQPARTVEEESHSLTLTPGLTPMRTWYRDISVIGKGPGIFLDCITTQMGRPYQKTNAADRIYQQFKLYDPDRAIHMAQRSRMFLGMARLGKLPPHTGEIAIDATSKADKRSMFLDACHLGFTCPEICTVNDRILQLAKVGQMAARASDKILLSITNHQQLKASSIHNAGEHYAGQYFLRSTF